MPDLAASLLKAEAATGKCYVLTFSEKHHVTLADMTTEEIAPVIDVWTNIYASHLSPTNPLSKVAAALQLPPPTPASTVPAPRNQLRFMQIFENKGSAMGCSNPHPHCQIWTTSTMPEEPGTELVQMAKYRSEHAGRHLLGDYVKVETEKKERTVFENDAFIVVCPWWAVWPFEVMLLPKRHVRALVDLSAEERVLFAESIQEVARRYDNLFETHFPYSKWSPSLVGESRSQDCRLRYSPGTPRCHRRRGREQLPPHALLPTSPSLCDRPKVPCRLRAHGRTAARHHSRAGCGQA